MRRVSVVVVVVAAVATSVWCATAVAGGTVLGPFICSKFQPAPSSVGQCVKSLTVDGGTFRAETGTSDGDQTILWENIDGTGHLLSIEITSTAELGYRYSINSFDGSVVRTLIVPPGVSDATLDLSSDNFYYVLDTGTGGKMSAGFDEGFGGL